MPHLRIATLLLIGMLGGGKAAIAGYVFTTIDSPDLFDTTAWGINDSGQIVGSYGNQHGFLATPTAAPEPSTLSLLAACLIGLGAMARCRKRAGGC